MLNNRLVTLGEYYNTPIYCLSNTIWEGLVVAFTVATGDRSKAERLLEKHRCKTLAQLTVNSVANVFKAFTLI